MQALLCTILRWLQTFLTSHHATKSLLRLILQVRSALLGWLAQRTPFCQPNVLGAAGKSTEQQMVFRPTPDNGEKMSLANICASRAPERNSFGEFLTAHPLFPSQSTGHSSSTSDLQSANFRPSFLRQNASIQHIDDTQREQFRLRNISTPNLRAHAHGPRPRTSSRLSHRTASPDPNRSTLTLSVASNVRSACSGDSNCY